MTQAIIYPNDNGSVALIIPTPDWLAQDGNAIEILAAKDVPVGKPYKIVEFSDLPQDHTFFNAWEYPA